MPRHQRAKIKPVKEVLDDSERNSVNDLAIKPINKAKTTTRSGRVVKKTPATVEWESQSPKKSTVKSNNVTTPNQKKNLDQLNISEQMDALTPFSSSPDLSESELFGPTPSHINPNTGQRYCMADYDFEGEDRSSIVATPQVKRYMESLKRDRTHDETSTRQERPQKRDLFAKDVSTPTAKVPAFQRHEKNSNNQTKHLVEDVNNGASTSSAANKTKTDQRTSATTGFRRRSESPIEFLGCILRNHPVLNNQRSCANAAARYNKNVPSLPLNTPKPITPVVITECASNTNGSCSLAEDMPSALPVPTAQSSKSPKESSKEPPKSLCPAINRSDLPQTPQLAKVDENTDMNSSSDLPRKTPRRSCVRGTYKDLVDSDGEEDKEKKTKMEMEKEKGKTRKKEENNKRKEKKEAEKLLERSYKRAEQARVRYEKTGIRLEKRRQLEEKRRRRQEELDDIRRQGEYKRDQILERKKKLKEIKDQKEFEKDHRNQSQKRLDILRERVENAIKENDAQLLYSINCRLRARSEPPSFTRNALLVPISSPSDKAYRATYFGTLNRAVELMTSSPEQVLDFAEKASKLSSTHYFNSIKDPFFEASLKRKAWSADVDWGQLPDADCRLKFDEADSLLLVKKYWLPEVQNKLPRYFKRGLSEMSTKSTQDNVQEFVEQFGMVSLRRIKLPTVQSNNLQRKRLALKAKYFVDKFLFLLKLWKNGHPDNYYPRVVEYFFFVIQKISSGREEDEDFLKNNYEVPRDLMFWLPIHLGNLQDSTHVPREELIDLARELFAILLDEWATSFVTEEELEALYRLQLASLRLECYSVTLKDSFPFWKQANPVGLIEQTNQSEKTAERRRSRRKTRNANRSLLDTSICQNEQPTSSGRRRHHSFSEFTDCAKITKKPPSPWPGARFDVESPYGEHC